MWKEKNKQIKLREMHGYGKISFKYIFNLKIEKNNHINDKFYVLNSYNNRFYPSDAQIHKAWLVSIGRGCILML